MRAVIDVAYAATSRTPAHWRAVLAALVAGFTFGCTSVGGLDVDVNEQVPTAQVTTFTLGTVDMPGFLEPYFRDELVAALASRGATEVPAGGDAEFVLRFTRTPLGSAPASADQTGERTASEEAERFVARVELSMRLRDAPGAVRLGSLSRVHTVTAGAYMHQRARAQTRRGFERLLQGLMPQ